MASLAYDSDSSIEEDSAIDAIISDLLTSNRGKLFLLVPTKSLSRAELMEVSLRESSESDVLEIVQGDVAKGFVRLGDEREEDLNRPNFQSWYYFVFPSTFPGVAYAKGSLEAQIAGLTFQAALSKVTNANDSVLNRLRAGPEVIDLTGEDDELQVLKF